MRNDAPFVPQPRCRFIVSDVREGELRDRYAYSLFEPDLALEVMGRNAFEAFGQPRVPVLAMESREVWLRETANLVRDADRGKMQWEYHYPLLGTSSEVYVTPSEGNVNIYVNWARQGQGLVGAVPLRDWVEAVARISRELSELFRKYQPSSFRDSLLAAQEVLLQEIESWLAAHP